MKRLSSSATLILKLFVPIFWAVFFGCFVIALLFLEVHNPIIKSTYFKVGLVIFYLLGLGILYISLWQLRRVEVDEDHFYVTDYFKTVRIPFPLVKKITEVNFLIFSTLTIHLHQKGYFGKRVTLVQSKQKVDDFLRSRVDLHGFFGGEGEDKS